MKIMLIAAVDDNYGLSYKGKIPWHLPADFKHFKETTEGHPVIMGRKTWESLPPKFRPLPNRENIVLSRSNTEIDIELCYTFNNIQDALLFATSFNEKTRKDKIFIIGGGEIYTAAMPYATDIILTEVAGVFETDTYFPEIDDTWDSKLIDYHAADEKNSHNFRITHFIRNNE